MPASVSGAASGSGEERRFRLRPVLTAISVVTAGVMPAFLLGGLAVQVRSEIGFGTAALGLAVALFFATSALASATAGRVVERVGATLGMRLTALGAAASMLGVALLARSWVALAACLVLGGLSNALSHPASNLSLAREVPAGRQGLSFGIKQSAIPAATLLAGLAVPLVATTVGWRWAFVGGAALSLMVALLVRGGVGGLAPPSGGESRATEATFSALVLLAVGIGLGSAAITPLGAFLVESSVAAGLGAAEAGLLLALGSGLNILVRVVLGRLADEMSGGRLRIVAGMLALGAAGLAILATGTAGWLLVAGVVLAFGAGWGWTGLFNFAVVITNRKAPAAATGVTQMGASAGSALGPLVFGLVVEAASFGVAYLMSAALALAAAGAVVLGRRRVLGGSGRR